MIVLAIDTATEMVSVAIVDGDELLAAGESASNRRHAEDLTPMIEFVVQRAGLSFGDLDAVAVDVGPGLFTGMRVGIAAAQVLAHVLAVPLVGIDGLEALVAATRGVVGDHELIAPTIDARRREVAWALHRVRDDGSVVRVSEPCVGTLEDLLVAVRDRAQSTLLVGDYALTHKERILGELGSQSWSVSFGATLPTHPHAKHVAALAHARLLREEVVVDSLADGGAPSVPALYLREADAEINWPTRSAS